MPCRYCGADTKLIEAHVIPHGFFRRMGGPGNVVRILANNDQDYPKRVPAGIYDATILCETCERLFSDWDTYAQQVLTDSPADEAVLNEDGRGVVCYIVHDWKYDLLKLFFVSLAWRASVSTHRVYKRVGLGPYEPEAKRLLARRDPGSPEHFAVILAKLDQTVGQSVFEPHRTRWDGVSFAHFYFGRYEAYVKADRRSVPPWPVPCMLAPDAPLVILARPLAGSKLLRAARDIATRKHNRLPGSMGRPRGSGE